jgi:hypothetical protein
MQTKTKTVYLVTPYGEKQAFSIDHAERLLGMGDFFSGGWKIDEDSEYFYDVKNGIRLKSNKAISEETK